MTRPVTADLQRWSQEVASDPGSLAFLPLARAYRRQGQRDAALNLCLRGLEAHPMNVEGHGLLALLYLEAGDRERAADEWSMVLRLDPGNFDALRGLGFCYLETGELERSRQHLEAAALTRPADPAVREALQLLRQRQEARKVKAAPDPFGGTTTAGHGADGHPSGAAAAEVAPAPRPSPPVDAAAVEAAEAAHAAHAAHAAVLAEDPTRLFDAVMRGPVLGALLLDAQGLILAGTLREPADASAEGLGAGLGDAVEEAARTAEHLSLGAWEGILLHTEVALLHLAPAPGDTVVVLAARRDAPVGWVMRGAARARELASRFLESYA
ncbi:MAG: tetratricopeptide repeat protein [Gemmatimonadota bacterium]